MEQDLERGLELARAGEYFAAHEALEDAWRAAEPAEKDFFQGLVHVVVAWYQAGRGNEVGCTRQLEKAARRLAPVRTVASRRRRRASSCARSKPPSALGSLDLDPLEVPSRRRGRQGSSRCSGKSTPNRSRNRYSSR